MIRKAGMRTVEAKYTHVLSLDSAGDLATQCGCKV